ncbi:MAG: retroviral-like aspartic protease [Candidatus Heimdallarchaeota archaeon]|nr:retroviral-like aspartic protease [Candidatus Heimdallarchaeota archaeon]
MGEISKRITVSYFRDRPVRVKALIDSGATDNFVNLKTTKKLGITERMLGEKVYYSTAKKKKEVGRLTSFRIWRRNRFVSTEFIVADIHEDLILGQTFLQDNHVIVNFSNDTFELGKYAPRIRKIARY